MCQGRGPSSHRADPSNTDLGINARGGRALSWAYSTREDVVLNYYKLRKTQSCRKKKGDPTRACAKGEVPPPTGLTHPIPIWASTQGVAERSPGPIQHARTWF